VAEARRLTGKRGVDIVVEHVGQARACGVGVPAAGS
jgi:NADPH:quinone reductase-like Zn-dependent oxidoreductase